MNRSLFSWIWVLSVAAGCNGFWSGSANYKKLEEKELASGKRVPELFYDMKLGMSRKDFFTYCWEMHQKGKFLDGENSTSVLSKLDKELNYPVAMNFFPDFYQDKIYKMRVKFEYVAWAPWNKALFSDSLILQVIPSIGKMESRERFYQTNGFQKQNHLCKSGWEPTNSCRTIR